MKTETLKSLIDKSKTGELSLEKEDLYDSWDGSYCGTLYKFFKEGKPLANYQSTAGFGLALDHHVTLLF